jgi:hypothetical protein
MMYLLLKVAFKQHKFNIEEATPTLRAYDT